MGVELTSTAWLCLVKNGKVTRSFGFSRPPTAGPSLARPPRVVSCAALCGCAVAGQQFLPAADRTSPGRRGKILERRRQTGVADLSHTAADDDSATATEAWHLEGSAALGSEHMLPRHYELACATLRHLKKRPLLSPGDVARRLSTWTSLPRAPFPLAWLRVGPEGTIMCKIEVK